MESILGETARIVSKDIVGQPQKAKQTCFSKLVINPTWN